MAVDRISKFAYAELHTVHTKKTAADFLTNLIHAVLYQIHTVLTDHGIQFTHHDHHKHAFVHIFDRIGNSNDIEHRKNKV